MTAHSPVLGPGNGLLARGQLYLATPAPLDYAVANTYEPIPGTWAGNALRFFSANSNGTLTYQGCDNTAILFVGSSDLKVSKNCALYYGLFKNGALVTGMETPVTVATPNHIYGMAIAGIVTLNYGDALRVYSKCDDEDAVLTPSTLSIVFWGDHR